MVLAPTNNWPHVTRPLYTMRPLHVALRLMPPYLLQTREITDAQNRSHHSYASTARTLACCLAWGQACATNPGIDPQYAACDMQAGTACGTESVVPNNIPQYHATT